MQNHYHLLFENRRGKARFAIKTISIEFEECSGQWNKHMQHAYYA